MDTDYKFNRRYELTYQHKHNGKLVTIRAYGKIKRHAYAEFVHLLKKYHSDLKNDIKDGSCVEVALHDLVTGEVVKRDAQVNW